MSTQMDRLGTHYKLLAFLLFVVVEVHAQVSTGTITGTVKDGSGAVLPGANLAFLNEETGVTRIEHTDAAGRYSVFSLSVGPYRITANREGFQTAVRTGMVLTVGQQAVVNFELQVGAITQEVEVKSEAPLVETTGATVSAMVGEHEMADLPLNGRSFDLLIALDSGTANYNGFVGQTSGQGFGSKFTVAGQRWESNQYYQDGTEMLGNAKGAENPGSASGLLLGVDAVREFRLLTNNYTAEYGKKAGGVVIMVTKNGTNELHSSAFEFIRNNNLDARNFFDKGNGPPQFKRNNFGGSGGGPIKKDKMFFFGNYEGVRQRLGVTQIAVVPDENARKGLLPIAGGGLRQVSVNPLVSPYMAIFPLPNGRNFGDGTAELSSPVSTATNDDFGMGRFDYNISNSDSLFVSSTIDAANVTIPQPLPVFIQPANTRSYTASLDEKHIFSPTLLHDFHIGFNRSFYWLNTVPVTTIDARLAFTPGEPFGDILFQNGVSNIGNVAGPNEQTTNVFQSSEQVFYTRGAHSWNLGWQIQRIQKNEIQSDRIRGEMTFATLDAFLAGTPVAFSGLLPVGSQGILNIGIPNDENLRKGWRQTYGGFYAQDSWKATSNFTVDAGLRLELITAPSEVNGRTTQLVVDHVTPAGLFLQTTPRVGVPIMNNAITLAPRLGLAWDPRGNGRTTVRAGFGVFYELIDDYYRFFQDSSPPFTTRADLKTNINFPKPFSALNLANITLSGRGVFPNVEPATVFQYNLGVQQELLPGVAVKLGYVGSKAYHLSNSPSTNLVPADILPDGRKYFPAGRALANPIWGYTQMLSTDANSWYNSFRVEVEKRFGSSAAKLGNLRLKTAFTFAKSTDQHSVNQNSAGANSPSQPMDPLNLAREKGLSNFDIRKNMTANFTYGLPRLYSGGPEAFLFNDWSLNGILTVQSGFPGDVQVGFIQSRDGENTSTPADRPDLAPGAKTNPVLGGPDKYFNPSGFLLPAAGFYGNLGRNTLIMPGLVGFDSSVFKGFSLSERYKLQFRAEFFNVLNRANFGTPALKLFTSSGSRIGTAGRVSSTTSASRQIQFGLRLEF